MKTDKKKCGVIMPIAQTDGYDTNHWSGVYDDLKDALRETDFEVRLVSEGDAVGLIHQRIVSNIFHDEIIICDVSSNNPNVMFELGLRLALNKPTIIIKDSKTNFLFDIGVIEHLVYKFPIEVESFEKFKIDLCNKVKLTYERFLTDPSYSPFINTFLPSIDKTSESLNNAFLAIEKDIEEINHYYSDLLKYEITEADFDRLKKVVLKCIEDFENNGSGNYVNKYQDFVFKMPHVLVKNFPKKVFSDNDLRSAFVKYNSWFIQQASSVQKKKLVDSFLNFLKDKEIIEYTDVIYPMFILIEQDKEMCPNYLNFMRQLKEILGVEKIKELLKISILRNLSKYPDLESEFL